VLPIAIDRAMWVALRPRGDTRVRLYAADFDEVAEAALDEPPPASGASRWQDYVRGTAWALTDHGHPIRGFEAVLHGDVPAGAGLSSSASLTVAVAFALASAFALPIDRKRLALYARKAEAEFTGIAVGIMDQFASALGVAGHALLIDCRTTDVTPIPLRLTARGPAIVVADSGIPRTLAGSAYNDRVAECRAATDAARTVFPNRPISTLRDLAPPDLPALRPTVAGSIFRRARHVVTENARVTAAITALQAGDFHMLGRLMSESHDSLRDDYDVSTPDLDLLVDLARAVPGVLGARLTGAGFGGCTVNLVERTALPAFAAAIARYRAETGHPGRMLVCQASDGAHAERV
jgi:galactokinase